MQILGDNILPVVAAKAVATQSAITECVRDIYILGIAKFVYKHQTDTLPEIFDIIFTVNNEIHNHNNTRQRGNLNVEHKVKKLENLKTRHQGTEIWNSTPTNIQDCKTINSFSITFRKFTLQSYSYL